MYEVFSTRHTHTQELTQHMIRKLKSSFFQFVQLQLMKLTLPHLHSSNVIITQNLHRKVYDRNHLFREYVSCSFFDFFYILLNRINFAYIIFHRGNVQTVISSSSRWIKPYKIWQIQTFQPPRMYWHMRKFDAEENESINNQQW